MSTTTIEDKKKYEEEEIFGTKNGNEEKAGSTEVEAFAVMTSLRAYKNEEMKGNNEENEATG